MKRIVKFKLFGIFPLVSFADEVIDESHAVVTSPTKQNAVLAYNDQRFSGVRIYNPAAINANVKIGRGTYIAENSRISMTTIGNFCSIGPNFICGWGIHPTNGISTAPCFYSRNKQNGMTFSAENKIAERKPIVIGNDVFIGMNVCILDGVTVGDGAIIGAGAVVNKDIPSYAIAVGVPARVVKYRFPQHIVEKLNEIQWWNWDNDKLQNVEKMFFDIEAFVRKYGEDNENGGVVTNV